MTYPLLWLCLGVLIVATAGFWLRRLRDRFISELKAAHNPMADGPMDKEFRKAFQIWLLRKGFATPQGQSRGADLFVFIGVAALIGLGVFSFIGSSE